METTPSTSLRLESRVAWWTRLADASYLSIFIYGAIPETLIGKPYIGPAPFHFWILYLGLFATFVEWLLESPPSSKLHKFLVGVFVAYTVWGFALGNSFKFIVIDASAFLGLVAGYHWALIRGAPRVLQCWRFLLPIIVIFLALTLAGLLVGAVPRGAESGRLYTYSVFRCTSFLTLVCPVMWLWARSHPIPSIPDWLAITPFVLGIPLVLGAASLSATRSVFLGGLVSFALWLRMIFHKQKGRFLVCLALLGSLALLIHSLGIIGEEAGGELGSRFSKTGGQQETRWLELQMLLYQMELRDWIVGMGFGSQFQSPVLIQGSDLASSPHLSVFTFLQKGGILLFFTFVIFPYLWLMVKLFRGREDTLQLGFQAGALLYLIVASVTASWDFLQLFLYGSFWGLQKTPFRGSLRKF